MNVDSGQTVAVVHLIRRPPISLFNYLVAIKHQSRNTNQLMRDIFCVIWTNHHHVLLDGKMVTGPTLHYTDFMWSVTMNSSRLLLLAEGCVQRVCPTQWRQ